MMLHRVWRIGAVARTVGSVRGLSGARYVEDNEDVFELVSVHSKDKLLVLDWTAAWCGPCKKISPIVDQLATTHADQVTFLKVDVDVHIDAAQEAGVQAMPTFQFIRQNKVLEQFAGADAAKLKEVVERLKAKAN